MSNNLDVVLPTEGLWRGTETQGIEDFTINLDPSAASASRFDQRNLLDK